jgi:hypothetical protein
MMDTGYMKRFVRRALRVSAVVVAVAWSLIGLRQLAVAGARPGSLMHSFAFPSSLASGVSGELVAPAGGGSPLRFDRGMVAIGYLPVPRPDRPGRHGRPRGERDFVRPPDGTPHVRLLLVGVVDADGKPVNNAGNELVVDAVVSPGGAASAAPPFVVPFDIHDGTAFLDAPLPVQGQPDASARVQILGAEVVDPDGQPFGTLGFEVLGAPATPMPTSTPAPGGTPEALGRCFASPDCTGTSFPASRGRCCRAMHGHRGHAVAAPPSWCPPEQFDAATGQCVAQACAVCAGEH